MMPTVSLKDELKQLHGDNFFEPREGGPRQPTTNWTTVCVCGHLAKFHAPAIGGDYRFFEPSDREVKGVMWSFHIAHEGCNGAMPGRGAETDRTDRDETAHVITTTVLATCPCTEFRPVARLDRPNRMWNQRIPRDPSDRARHPFHLGLKAMTTFLAGRKAALADPDWADAELDRRFEWIDRRCWVGRCKETDGVWPVFVNGDLLSELRCPKHQP